MALEASQSRQIIYTHSFISPVGTLHAAVDRLGHVLNLGFNPISRIPAGVELEENKYACGELEFQLQEYFTGQREQFTVETRLDGTGFQQTVWNRLMKIGFGETVTYGEVARKIGNRDAAQAVGNAVAANPVALLVPCHRVVPASGGIGNYARRGLDDREGRRIKRYLLDLESGRRELSISS
ncbi:MAG: methylated-DNA--[protein]-cysteine S-methyltransferase [Spirochaetia bacterium]